MTVLSYNSINPVGFGCWQLAGAYSVNGRANGWGAMSDRSAIETVHFALDQGINFFDTADAYGQGVSEERLGKALRARSGSNEDIFICTKYGNRFDGNGCGYQDFSNEWLREAVHDSFKRLQRDYIDCLLLHSPPDDMDWLAFNVDTLEQLIKEGKIGSYGVSSKTVYGAEKVLAQRFGGAIEVTYNLLDRRAAPIVFERASDRLMIARVPLASGFLAPKTLAQTRRFDPNDIRSFIGEDDQNWRQQAVKALAFLNELEGGISVSALRFCLSHPDINVVIPGLRTKEQVSMAVKAQSLGPLSEEIMQRIESEALALPSAWVREPVVLDKVACNEE